jgi:hypothetical protein
MGKCLAKPLPKWLFIRYAKLWAKKKNQEFTFDEAKRLLMEKNDKTLGVILSELRRHGWLETILNAQNARKRNYHLRPPQEVVEEIAYTDDGQDAQV